MNVVTRYAPSPTGALHIGGARTALFNWAYARHHGGRFLLRVEDTDRERSTRESEEAVLEAMRWLGLDWDQAPGFDAIPRQSERGARYQECVDQLLASGAAYRCSCTTEEVEAMRETAKREGHNPGYNGHCRKKNLPAGTSQPFCVRLKIPADGVTHWEDAIAGASGQEVDQLDDFIIARTDGTPIYHLAVVVDDHDMGITLVIRGREHMTSTPRQLLLYRALGFEPPQFAHAPLLVDAKGKKLSKREDAASVQYYRDRGFTPESLLNFIARLGWAHGDVEIVDAENFVELFELKDVGISPSQVHEDKLLWISQQYLKSLPMDRLQSHLQPFIDAVANGNVEFDNTLTHLLDLLRERSKTLVEMAELTRFYLHDDIEWEPKAAQKFLKKPILEPLRELRVALAKLDSWNESTLSTPFESITASHEIKLGKLAQPVRVAIVGSSASPGIFETLEILGQQRTLTRMDAAIRYIEALD